MNLLSGIKNPKILAKRQLAYGQCGWAAGSEVQWVKHWPGGEHALIKFSVETAPNSPSFSRHAVRLLGVLTLAKAVMGGGY